MSEAINISSMKSIDVDSLPFDIRVTSKVRYNRATVLPVDPKWGSSVLPADVNDEDDDVYEQFVR